MKNNNTTSKIGSHGEQIAASYLTEQGYSLLARNYKVRGGEIDIIALDGSTLVFIEVKTRKSTRFGAGAEAVDSVKINRLVTAAERYVFENSSLPELADCITRFDVIEIYLLPKTQINHIKAIDIN